MDITLEEVKNDLVSNPFISNLSFDFNETGFPFTVVPNIVHYILFDVQRIDFIHFISILSVLKNQRPNQIIIHCNCHQLSGYLFQRVAKVATKLKTSLLIRTVKKPTQIFGHKLSNQSMNWHSYDITINRVLQEFGGIYLDRNVYIVQSLDVFRKYEMTLEWNEDILLTTHLLIGHKNARFLKLWLNSYRKYEPSLWYHNKETDILIKRPELVHRVKKQFGGSDPMVCSLLYKYNIKNWRENYYAFDLYIRGNQILDYCFQLTDTKDWPVFIHFNESMVRDLNVTFGEMTRILFDFENYINFH